jgi:hypothetical protein
MPKPHTFPTLYDDLLHISATRLKEWGQLKPQRFTSSKITWSRNGNETDQISITINTQSEKPYIELDYLYRGEPRNYKVRLVNVQSNLGKGLIWYFLCPKTKKRCRQLYLVDGWFYHREAFKEAMYSLQTYSLKDRFLCGQWDKMKRADKARQMLYSKHFKKYYKGKPTKRYLKALKWIREGEGISEAELLMGLG